MSRKKESPSRSAKYSPSLVTVSMRIELKRLA